MEGITAFFDSQLFYNLLLVLKIIFLVISAFFLGMIIYLLIVSDWLKKRFFWDIQEFLTYRAYGAKKMSKEWRKVSARLDTNMEAEYKLAVIEADSILDDTLKRMNFSGDTLGERLEKLTSATLPNVNDVVEAHRVRNNIVHDPDYKLTLEEAKTALQIYERALTDLQVL